MALLAHSQYGDNKGAVIPLNNIRLLRSDGSNWENLCVYCHEDVHSRELLGEYYDGRGAKEKHLVHTSGAEDASGAGLSGLGEKLRQALEEKGKKRK